MKYSPINTMYYAIEEPDFFANYDKWFYKFVKGIRYSRYSISAERLRHHNLVKRLNKKIWKS